MKLTGRKAKPKQADTPVPSAGPSHLPAPPLDLDPAVRRSDPEPEATTTWFAADPAETPEQIDARWRRETFRGHIPQLTLRAWFTGTLLGGLMALSNLYVGLKAGWSMGVAVTASLLGFGIFKTLQRFGLAKPLTILENNCLQSTASAAGFATMSMAVTAMPAYLLITGRHIDPLWMGLWSLLASLLGLFMIVPLKRQLLHYEELPFPSGIAAAQMLTSLHERGGKALKQSRVFFASLGVGAMVQWSITNSFAWWKLPRLPEVLTFPGRLLGRPLGDFTIGLDGSLVYAAAGALLGLRVSLWMLAGAGLTYVVVTPALFSSGWLQNVSYRDVQVTFALWTGAAMMVSASLVTLFFQRSAIAKAFRELGSFWPGRSRATEAPDTLAQIEVSPRWFVWGVPLATVGIVWVGQVAFGMPWWISCAGVLASLLFVLVTVRAMGETDIAPIGSLGKIAQLGAGVAVPSITTNIMSASIATGSAASAADALIRQKCGYLLGARTRSQFLAQLLGIVSGTLVVVPAFYLLVPTPDRLGTATFPAPAAQAWRFVAELMVNGIDALALPARIGLAVGVGLGALLALWEQHASRRAWWVPSPMGLGMGMVIFFSNALSFVLGAAMAEIWRRRAPRASEDYLVPVSSGVIAGESLLGILLAALVALGWMVA